MAARAGFEPMTHLSKGFDSTNASPHPTRQAGKARSGKLLDTARRRNEKV